jgi:hypothetical protein
MSPPSFYTVLMIPMWFLQLFAFAPRQQMDVKAKLLPEDEQFEVFHGYLSLLVLPFLSFSPLPILMDLLPVCVARIASFEFACAGPTLSSASLLLRTSPQPPPSA